MAVGVLVGCGVGEGKTVGAGVVGDDEGEVVGWTVEEVTGVGVEVGGADCDGEVEAAGVDVGLEVGVGDAGCKVGVVDGDENGEDVVDWSIL